MKSRIAKRIETIATEVRGAMKAARGRVIGFTEALWSRRPTTLLENVIGAPAKAVMAKMPAKPKAVTKRAAQTASNVERLKKTVTPARAAARRSSAKPRKTKVVATKKTGRRAKPV